MTPEAYRARLVEPLLRAPRREPAPLPPLPANIWFKPKIEPLPVGVRDLYLCP